MFTEDLLLKYPRMVGVSRGMGTGYKITFRVEDRSSQQSRNKFLRVVDSSRVKLASR